MCFDKQNYMKLWKEKNRKAITKYNKFYKEKYNILKPWAKFLYHIKERCNEHYKNRYPNYYQKNIKNFLTLEDLEYLWKRDKAYLLNHPSIHRKNINKHYTIDNCQFIEWNDHKKEGQRIGGFKKGHSQFNTGRTQFKKGHKTWNKGLKGIYHHSEETKKKMSLIKLAQAIVEAQEEKMEGKK